MLLNLSTPTMMFALVVILLITCSPLTSGARPGPSSDKAAAPRALRAAPTTDLKASEDSSSLKQTDKKYETAHHHLQEEDAVTATVAVGLFAAPSPSLPISLEDDVVEEASSLGGRSLAEQESSRPMISCTCVYDGLYGDGPSVLVTALAEAFPGGCKLKEAHKWARYGSCLNTPDCIKCLPAVAASEAATPSRALVQESSAAADDLSKASEDSDRLKRKTMPAAAGRDV